MDGILALLESGEHMPVNIGNPHEVTIREFAELINNATGNSAGIVYEDRRTQGDPQQRQPDLTRARTLLHWEPRVALAEGLHRTINAFRARLQEPAPA